MGWLALLSLAKFGFYLGVIGFIGITSMLWLFHRHYTSCIPDSFAGSQLRVLGVSLVISIVGALVVVPLNAGLLMDDGVIGITDRFMLQITWESTIGEQARARFTALVMMVIGVIGAFVQTNNLNWPRNFKAFLLLTTGVISWSFTQSGHTATTSVLAQGLITLHVVMAGWWVGSFYPLLRLCHLAEPAPLRHTLQQYGKQAMVWVSALLLSGTALLILLILNVDGELNSTYLMVMAGKLVLVCVMLGFAAYHKWRLVKALETVQDCLRAKKSIISEAVVGLLVLATTATLTSSFGIAH